MENLLSNLLVFQLMNLCDAEGADRSWKLGTHFKAAMRTTRTREMSSPTSAQAEETLVSKLLLNCRYHVGTSVP